MSGGGEGGGEREGEGVREGGGEGEGEGVREGAGGRGGVGGEGGDGIPIRNLLASLASWRFPKNDREVPSRFVLRTFGFAIDVRGVLR